MRKVPVLLLVIALLATGCASSASKAKGRSDVLRLGMFPNLTHAPAYVALGEGIFDRVLASTKVEVTYFNSGSDAQAAVTTGAIDATYIGPGPSISAYLTSEGSVAIVSGVTSGGASFVVRKGSGISTPEDLHGKKIAVPGIGNTQDVALRTWLNEHGLQAKDAGGDVAVAAIDNPELLQNFRSGQVDGAWEPEPWPSYLIEQGVAEPFLDEATLWPDGRFVVANLLVNTVYMQAHPEVVKELVRANVEAIRAIHEDPEEAKKVAQAGLIQAGAPSLDQAVVDAAWSKLEFTWDPVPGSLEKDAKDAYALGMLAEDPGIILAIYRLDDLNAILDSLGEPAVELPA
ncbi:MAG TPA: ABC transporter substrate-binding protein [Actinomycetota bacterium]